MIYFNCDYNEGAHPKVLQKLIDTNLEQTPGYGEDHYCEEARRLLCQKCGTPDAYVQFLVGGTQTNATVIASILRPHQGVLCPETGHINSHESGAVEACGHKVLALPSQNGKITGDQVRAYCKAHWENYAFEHTVQPGMVYTSHPSEIGTLYTKAELTDLYAACREWHLPLFVDGARLGYGIASPESDVGLQDLARLCDVFYIGGTKVGALFGEAVVMTDPALKTDFRYILKQHGGMLAKGRLLGLQYLALFEDDLYFAISRHAVTEALRIRDALRKKGFPFLVESPTNQQFPILPDTAIQKLREQFVVEDNCRIDETHSAIRICTSWATRTEDVDKLLAAVEAL